MIIASWGDVPKILPATVCANLTSNVGWSIGTAVLPTDENSAIEIRPSDIPKSMREDEVDQSEEEETAEEHQDDDETGGISEPLRNLSMKNERPGDDTSTDLSEISDDEEQNSITIRRLRTAYSDEWLSDEKAEEIIHKVKIVIYGKTDIDKKEKADAFEKIQEVFADAQYSLDLAFAAGTLATTKSTARTDAVRYAEILQDREYKRCKKMAEINNQKGK